MANVVFTSTYSPSGQGSTTVNVKVSYTETYSASTDKTTLKITDIAIQVVGNTSTYNGIPLYGSLKVGSTTLYTFNAGATGITNISGSGYTTITYFEEKSVSISHTSDPKTVTIALVGGYTQGGNSYFCAVDTVYGTGFIFGVVAQSKSITLTTRHFKVSYNANGGTGAPSAQTKKYGQTLTLSSTTPTRSAETVGTYTVTYNANGGSVSPTSAKATRTSSYSFASWNTKADGSGTSKAAGASYTSNAAATFYAQWTASSPVTSSVTLPTPTRSGYAFDGWYNAATGGTRVGGAGSSYTPASSITLYAQWTGTASTISATGSTFGSAVALTITRESSYRHTVTTSCAGITETVATKTASTSLSWTPAVATYAPAITNSMSASVTITCQTYDGNTLIGTTSITRTLSFDPSDVAPTVSQTRLDATRDEDNVRLAAKYGAYVQGKSRMEITLTETTQYGASVVSRSITANGATYSTNPATTGLLTTAGSMTVSATIRDSRGQTATSTDSNATVLPYSNPSFPVFTVERCDGSGVSDNTGAYFKVNYRAVVSPLNNRNSKALVLKYKKRSASSYGSATITMSSYDQTGTSSVIEAEINSSYDVRLELTDDFTTSVQTLVLPTATTHINHGAGVNGGIGIGKVSEYEKTVEIAEDWSVRFGSSPFGFQSVNIASSGGVGTISVGTTKRGILITSGPSVNDKSMTIFASTTAGTLSFATAFAGSNITVSSSTSGVIRIANSGANYISAFVILTSGA